MGPKPNTTAVSMRRGTQRHRQQRKPHVEMEAEIGLRLPRAKGTIFTGDHRKLEEVGRSSLPQHSERVWFC